MGGKRTYETSSFLARMWLMTALVNHPINVQLQTTIANAISFRTPQLIVQDGPMCMPLHDRTCLMSLFYGGG
jgi:hypothetical protein